MRRRDVGDHGAPSEGGGSGSRCRPSLPKRLEEGLVLAARRDPAMWRVRSGSDHHESTRTPGGTSWPGGGRQRYLDAPHRARVERVHWRAYGASPRVSLRRIRGPGCRGILSSARPTSRFLQPQYNCPLPAADGHDYRVQWAVWGIDPAPGFRPSRLHVRTACSRSPAHGRARVGRRRSRGRAPLRERSLHTSRPAVAYSRSPDGHAYFATVRCVSRSRPRAPATPPPSSSPSDAAARGHGAVVDPVAVLRRAAGCRRLVRERPVLPFGAPTARSSSSRRHLPAHPADRRRRHARRTKIALDPTVVLATIAAT